MLERSVLIFVISHMNYVLPKSHDEIWWALHKPTVLWGVDSNQDFISPHCRSNLRFLSITSDSISERSVKSFPFRCWLYDTVYFTLFVYHDVYCMFWCCLQLRARNIWYLIFDATLRKDGCFKLFCNQGIINGSARFSIPVWSSISYSGGSCKSVEQCRHSSYSLDLSGTDGTASTYIYQGIAHGTVLEYEQRRPESNVEWNLSHNNYFWLHFQLQSS